jgi:hypothetical protein
MSRVDGRGITTGLSLLHLLEPRDQIVATVKRFVSRSSEFSGDWGHPKPKLPVQNLHKGSFGNDA